MPRLSWHHQPAPSALGKKEVLSRTGLRYVDIKLAAVVLPVSDVDRAKAFYRLVGFREDIDYCSGDDFRVVQLTPPGSEASIIFGKGITGAAPGSLQGLQLAVDDIETARTELIDRGVDVGYVFHDVGRVFYHLSSAFDLPGPDPSRRDCGSFARFSDPDGNGWVLQEVLQRRWGR